jgi:hypothetical protein
MKAAVARLGRRLRLGVVAGGLACSPPPLHGTARLDGCYDVVAAILSRNPERSWAVPRRSASRTNAPT